MTARVLVVDDVEPNVRLLEAKLQHEYYTVITSNSGEEAILKALRDNPDVILLDVMMPGLDGFETCRRLKEDSATRHIPVVMVTALDQREDRIKGLAVGADDFLSKPIDDVTLFARVKSLARFKSSADELRLREAAGRRIGVIEGSLNRDLGLNARILVVEDDPRRAARLKKILDVEQRPMLMQDANDLGPMGQSTVELMIISASGVSFDGLRLAAHVRGQENSRNLPILAICEPDEKVRALRALEVGVNDFIYRPIDDEELLARTRTLVRRKRHLEHLRLMVDSSMELAVTDQLTGLHNRRYMESQLKGLLARAARGGPPVAVLIVDIDFFKRVNDLFGHDAGDDVIREFALRLASNFRPRDLACRYGGEEFVVIMPDTNAADATMIAERLRSSIEEGMFKVGAGRQVLDITCSVGVAIGHAGELDFEALLKRADEALYVAKRSGRNKVVAQAA
ncbi:PleD family two-component system response regulator [Candidatus Phycosocius spiralis]|uniref:diguanylate cyclase n=1 Tax=Candidatus Phycosocius spiralis TaxID=2815099 RepID=A0ABQ4PYE3_9PROT|nr:PleD family two-component system response regulator [Candidatus Phycosocius spiralis]GIU67981.1 response regulator PleD [Candidatus Phycosocius spiralis]